MPLLIYLLPLFIASFTVTNELFDRIYTLLILSAAVLYRNDRSKGLLSILILVRVVDEFLFYFSDLSFSKWIIYTVSTVVVYKYRHDKYSLFLSLPVLIASVSSELFWFFTGYASPGIHFYMGLIALNVFVRQLAFQRFITYLTESTPLDYHYYSLIVVMLVALNAVTFEYIVRHISDLSPLSIYYLFPSVSKFIQVVILAMVVIHLRKQKSKFHITF